MKSKQKLYIIDGSSYIYRAFYAFSELKTSDGFPTSGIFIVVRLILKLLKEKRPEYGCFLLDGKGPTFRNIIDSSYKANRQKMPEDLSLQIEPILEGVKLLGMPVLISEDAEADDYIASICEKFKSQCEIIIVGTDKDLFQLLDESIVMWDASHKTEKIITKKGFVEQNKISPDVWPLYQALVGDSSDNIKGVPGIGKKSALSILSRFSTIDDIFNNLHKLPPAYQKKLNNQRENVEKCLKLTTLKRDIDVPSTLDFYKIQKMDIEGLKEFFERYEFKSLLKEIETTKGVYEKNQDSKIDIQSLDIEKFRDISEGDNVAILSSGETFFIARGTHRTETRNKEEVVDVINGAKKVFVSSLKELMYNLEPYYFSINNIFDVSLGAYLIDPEMRDYSLERLIGRFLSGPIPSQDRLYNLTLLGEHVFELVLENDLFPLYEEIEMPLVPVLISMEKNGIKIDKNKFRLFLEEVENELSSLTNRIYHRAGEEFNIRSNKQLSYILFQKMGLKPGKKTPKGGLFSTSSEVLDSLKHQHPIIEDILQYRKLEKIRSTYLVPLASMADERDRIHTTFNQLATATGRLSSSNPNLQNIPIRGSLGKKMRSCFIAEDGNVIISADYSQIELRILAHFSEDPYLLSAFLNNLDIHASTAAAIFDKNIEEVSSDDRRKAKTINFGLIYGMGPRKLSRELGISLTEAKNFIEKYFSKLKGVKRFFEQVETEAENNGYVTTLAGRKRHLLNINSKNNNLASQAKRMAINTKVQGSAADIIKLAMIKIYNNDELKEMDVKLLLQIHDELLFECREDVATKVSEIIKHIMSSVWDLNVPLIVDLGVGKNWAEAH